MESGSHYYQFISGIWCLLAFHRLESFTFTSRDSGSGLPVPGIGHTIRARRLRMKGSLAGSNKLLVVGMSGCQSVI